MKNSLLLSGAYRFDGDLEDVFELQDHVTASVMGAIAPKLEQAEIERAKRKPTESLSAYDCFRRGMASYHQISIREANEDALRLFNCALELDPELFVLHEAERARVCGLQLGALRVSW